LPIVPTDPGTTPAPKAPSPARRRFGIAAFAALTAFLCTGATGSCGPSSGEIVGGVVGIAAGLGVIVVVAVEVTNGHHTISGCVVSGPNGLELQTSDKRYALEGDASSIKVGDRVKIHGSRVKKTKDTAGDQVYRVEKLKKDYGPCPMTASAPGHAGF
jgi:hypothetical protein